MDGVPARRGGTVIAGRGAGRDAGKAPPGARGVAAGKGFAGVTGVLGVAAGACKQLSNSRAKASMWGKRSAGSFAIARRQVATRRGSTSGRNSETRGTSDARICPITTPSGPV